MMKNKIIGEPLGSKLLTASITKTLIKKKKVRKSKKTNLPKRESSNENRA
jgi:hypothetical protein